MYFYVPNNFFKVFFNFASIAKAASCKSRAHRGTPKGGKMSLLFFSNETAFFLCIVTCYFIFSNSLSILSAVQKQHFVRLKCIGCPQRSKNVSSFFLESNGIFACIFTCQFIFLKSFLILLPLQKQHFASLKRIGYPKRRKNVTSLYS